MRGLCFCSVSSVVKRKKVYALLPAEEYLDFDEVKAAVLRAQELVPEAYRQKFHRLRKQGYQTYVEFARAKETVFDRCNCNVKRQVHH